jgi:hypothetical protein
MAWPGLLKALPVWAPAAIFTHITDEAAAQGVLENFEASFGELNGVQAKGLP